MRLEHEGDYPRDSREWYIAEYLKFGSVEEVYKAHRWDILIPIASYHRLIKNAGIVKSSGRREVSLSEMLYFFAQKALEPSIGIETLYYQKMPPSFKTSLSTLHRIYKNIVERKPTRVAAALFIHPFDDENKILLGEENITARRFGRTQGDLSVPMCFAQEGELTHKSAMRVLQQEVLTPMAINGTMPVVDSISPFASFDILDVRVSMCELTLPNQVRLGSCKLANLHFENAQEIFEQQRAFRSGVLQMIESYLEYKTASLWQPKSVTSDLNLALLG